MLLLQRVLPFLRYLYCWSLQNLEDSGASQRRYWEILRLRFLLLWLAEETSILLVVKDPGWC